MFIKDKIFQVGFSLYSESHYCRDFYKKYKGRQWIETRKTIIDTLQRVFLVQQTSLIDVIKYSQEDGVGIFKYDFKIAGSNFSPKSSGNRVVFFLCNNTGRIEILLVYGKNHCDKKCSETSWILNEIKNNFPEYKKYS